MKQNYRKRYAKKTPSIQSKVNQALALARKANGASNADLRLHQTALSVSGVSSTGTVVAMSSISQGDENANREGNTISPTLVKLNILLTKHASATASQVRCIVFRYKVGTSSAVTDVLESASYTNSFPSVTKRRDFNILYDRLFDVSSD